MIEANLDKPVARTPRRVALVAAIATAILAIASQTALAQTGGAAAPGGTTTTEPTTPTPSPSGNTQVFPLPGAHTFGDGFGAARSGHTHQGQDIMAPCGSPLVAVSRARVKRVSFQALAGNYVVLRFKKLHQDYVYAHLIAPASVTPGQVVAAGQQIGNVGQTGNARACHLHFELWVGKWYRGGHPIDPLPYLQNWDSYS